MSARILALLLALSPFAAGAVDCTGNETAGRVFSFPTTTTRFLDEGVAYAECRNRMGNLDDAMPNSGVYTEIDIGMEYPSVFKFTHCEKITDVIGDTVADGFVWRFESCDFPGMVYTRGSPIKYTAANTCATRPPVADMVIAPPGGSDLGCDIGCEVQEKTVVNICEGCPPQSYEIETTGAVCSLRDGLAGPVPGTVEPEEPEEEEPTDPAPDPTDDPYEDTINPPPTSGGGTAPPTGGTGDGDTTLLSKILSGVGSLWQAITNGNEQAAHDADRNRAAVEANTKTLGDKLDEIRDELADGKADGGECGAGWTCSGDPVLCAQLREAHLHRCQAKTDRDSVIADAAANGDGPTYTKEDAWFDGESAVELNTEGYGWGSACPSLPTLEVDGHVFGGTTPEFCDWIFKLAALFQLVALAWALYIVGS